MGKLNRRKFCGNNQPIIYKIDNGIKGIIYKITNIIDNKVYVGQTKNKINNRLNDHSKNKSYIGNAIRKYGLVAFTITEIDSALARQKLNQKEQFWIAKFNCKIPNGYNLNIGGSGDFSNPTERNEKISKSLKGKKKTCPPWNKGRKMSDDPNYINPMKNKQRPDLSERNRKSKRTVALEERLLKSQTSTNYWIKVKAGKAPAPRRGIRKKKIRYEPEAQLCACGCSEYAKPGNTYINHHGCGKPIPKPIPNHHKCECGCGELVASNRRFKRGHSPNFPSSKGERNSHYKDGRSIKEAKWKEEVFQRDKYICQKCFKSKESVRLHSHHIKSRKEFPNLIYDTNNGITLCNVCHTSLHRLGQKASKQTKLKMSVVKKGKPIPGFTGKVPWNKGLKGTQIPWNKGIKG